MTEQADIAVILGGHSSEREVSLRTGNAVMEALKRKGHSVFTFDPKEKSWSDFFIKKPRVAFICLHGASGEDGSLQGFFETMRIPYTSSGVLASALCFDKAATKTFVSTLGVKTPRHQVFLRGNRVENFVNTLEFPVIVKPCREGSTIGMSIVKNSSDLPQALETAVKFDASALVEEFIQGTEVTSSVLNGQSLPLIEIRPKSGFYDYQSKYTPGQTQYILPAEISAEMENRIREVTAKIFSALHLRGAVRADYIIRGNDFYFLEVNTIPGMTETSLLPKSAAAAGIGFDELCEQILLEASV